MYTCMRNFVWIGLFCRPVERQTPELSAFSTSTSRGGAKHSSIQQYQNHFSNAFCAESFSQTLPFKNVTDRQTDKNSTFWLSRRRAKSEHGDRGPRARSSTYKRFRVRPIVSPLRGRWIFESNRTTTNLLPEQL